VRVHRAARLRLLVGALGPLGDRFRQLLEQILAHLSRLGLDLGLVDALVLERLPQPEHLDLDVALPVVLDDVLIRLLGLGDVALEALRAVLPLGGA